MVREVPITFGVGWTALSRMLGGGMLLIEPLSITRVTLARTTDLSTSTIMVNTKRLNVPSGLTNGGSRI
ncbi:hypothetical protein LINGRAHAP2_LOCUS7566 [Linum grandiflorum]